MTSTTNPDKIIEEMGGCGRFQIMINVVSHAMKIVTCFSISSMKLSGKFFQQKDNNKTLLIFTKSHFRPKVQMSPYGSYATSCPKKTCTVNGTTCSSFEFSGTMQTVVTEFGLVCDLDYIPSLIMSIQVAGTLAGNIVCGHIAEYIGRKKPFFFSVVVFIIFNLVGYFTVNWVMFAIARMFIGLAAGFFMTSTYSLLCEFSLAKWRVWIIGFPSWPLEACLFALVAWLVQDWRHLQLLIAIVGIPCLLPWFIIPESFRWYVAHDKLDQAKQIVQKVAAFNRREIDDLEMLMATQPKSTDVQERKYTLLDLFGTRKLIRISILLACNWFALGLVSYGIAFGIQSLSGSIYLNLFLFSLVGIPSKAIALWLQNRIGRGNTCVLCFILVAIGGIAVGVIEGLDISNKGSMINGFALVANIGITTAWGPVQTMTIELYPTVIRPIGFGTLSVVGRIGAIIGPQLVYVNLRQPGLMYYVLGAVGVLCIISSYGLPETKNASLNDKLEKRPNAVSPDGASKLQTSKDNSTERGEDKSGLI